MSRIAIVIALLALAGSLGAQEDSALTLKIFDISTITAPRIPRTGPRLGSTPSNASAGPSATDAYRLTSARPGSSIPSGMDAPPFVLPGGIP